MAGTLIEDALIIFNREMIIFRSNMRSNLLRSIIFPLVILLFFGNLGNGIFNSPIAVTNLANNPQSIQFINALQQQNSLSIKGVVSEDTGLSMLKQNKISALVVIPPGFPSKVGSGQSVYIYYSNAKLNTISASTSFITSIAKEFGVGTVAGGAPVGVSTPTAPSSSVKLVSTSATTISYMDFLVGGVIAMVAAFGTIFGAGASLITDRQIGNLKLFLMTPISSTSLILGKAIYGTTTAMIYAALAILIAFMLGATVAQGVVGIIFILLITLVLSFGLSSLALVLASKIKKFEMYTILGNVMVLPLWFLSGAFFPSSSMPTWMQYISAADPLTYAVNGIRGFMLTTYYPVTSILIDFALLAVFAIVMFTLAVKLFKNKIG